MFRTETERYKNRRGRFIMEKILNDVFPSPATGGVSRRQRVVRDVFGFSTDGTCFGAPPNSTSFVFAPRVVYVNRAGCTRTRVRSERRRFRCSRRKRIAERIARPFRVDSNDRDFRAGINHGPITAGVIGARKPHYDIWGNSVNVASRMESTGKAGCIQVSADFVELDERRFFYYLST